MAHVGLTEGQRALLDALSIKHGIPDREPERLRIRSDVTAITARELEVLQLAADGLRNTEIGAELWIVPETVKTHMRNIIQKLGAANRTHAVSIGHRRRLVD